MSETLYEYEIKFQNHIFKYIGSPLNIREFSADECVLRLEDMEFISTIKVKRPYNAIWEDILEPTVFYVSRNKIQSKKEVIQPYHEENSDLPSGYYYAE